MIVSCWGLGKGLSVIVCAWMLTAAPSVHVAMIPIQDIDQDAPDAGAGLACTDGMETVPYTDDLDAIPVSDIMADGQCLDAPEPVAI